MSNSLFSKPNNHHRLVGDILQSSNRAAAGKIGSLFTLMDGKKSIGRIPEPSEMTITIGDPISGLTLLALRCEVANQSQV